MLMVPVGAMVVGAELRIGRGSPNGPWVLYVLPSQAGNVPLIWESSLDAKVVS